ncbi:hypothetical protein [Candidatus Nitrososphaera sp. FF02]|uniref:hypothetical protein n=1 Tax=Candidatus Nitrososphaera sp. FF02 TaxID=3398226 RepID=UPI0039ECBBD4
MGIIITAGFASQEAFAVDYTISDEASCENAPINGSWDGPSFSCEVVDLTIGAGDNVTIASGINFRNTIDGSTITNNGILQINSGAQFIQDGLNLLDNFGTVSNQGTINNVINFGEGGTIVNNVAGNFVNDGIIENFGTLTNDGTLDNNGDINNEVDGTFDNSGTASNDGQITNSGTIDNTGTLDNNGSMDNDCEGTFSGSIGNNQPVSTCDDPVIEDEFSCEFFLSAGSAEWSVDMCTIDADYTVDSGDSLTIASGVILIIDTGTVLTVDGTLTNNDEITNNGDIINNNIINNNGLIGNNAAITNNIGGTFNNEGSIDNRDIFTNDGTLDNNGDFFNNLFATITNSGTFTNDGDVSNSNIFDNTGTLNSNNSFSNSGDLTNSGTFTNSGSDVFSNTGTFTNTGTFDNDGTITNLDTIDNTGTFTNDGHITNLVNGIIDNNLGGTFTNACTISSTGDIVNAGTFTNDGEITNSGTLTNTGTFTNNDTIEVNCEGEISGTITGTVDDTCPSNNRRSGGGGQTVIVNPESGVPPVTLFPESYFEEHPLERIQVNRLELLDEFGSSVSQAAAGHQVSISGMFTNHQKVDQDYAFIVQITGKDGSVIYISWQQGTVESGRAAQVSMSWTPAEDGIYSVQIFVWNGLYSPTPLSKVTVDNIEVTE